MSAKGKIPPEQWVIHRPFDSAEYLEGAPPRYAGEPGKLAEAVSSAVGAALTESADTARLSATHAPIGKGGTNWITRSKPGNTGQLPAYIQNVRNAIMRTGKSVAQASAIAIGRVRDWAEGKGKVGPEVRAAAAKAIAEFDAMRAKSKGSKRVSEAEWLNDWPEDLSVAERVINEALWTDDELLAALEAESEFQPVEEAASTADKAGDGDDPSVKCPKCSKSGKPVNGKCANCGHSVKAIVNVARALRSKG